METTTLLETREGIVRETHRDVMETHRDVMETHRDVMETQGM